MTRKKFFTAFALPALLARSLAAAPAPEPPVTLRQCFEWSKTLSEGLKIREEDILQARARARAALGGALPRLEWDLTHTRQEPKGVQRLERQGFAGFVEKDQVESKASLKQPIFSGFREFSARAGFLREQNRDTLLLDRASRDLFEATADVFYNVVGRETEHENVRAALVLAEDRVKELKGFKRLGKVRDSEVFTAQAHAAALRGSLRQIEAQILSAREDLSALTGQDFSTRPLLDEIPSPPPVPPLKDALSRARGRADLRAQREDAEAKRLRVRYEKGFYWPTADITGNYYTQRAAFLDAIDWDVVLSVQVPFYQGGAVAARAREAASAWRQSLLTLERMERVVFHDVRKTRGELASSVEEVRSLEEAADAAQKSYDALQKEYRLGLVTNLDVFQALDLLLSQQSARDAARLNAKTLYISLGVAVEELP